MAFMEGEDKTLAVTAEGAEDLARIRAELVRAVARVCPGWLQDRSEDLVQVALLRVVDVMRRSPEGRELSAGYLRKAAYSAMVDEIRRLRRRQEVPLNEEQADIHPQAPQPDPEQRSAGGEIGRAIRDCLGRMVRPRKLAVTLHLQGYGVPEAARLLGWSPKKAENLVYRGLADLRECLTAKGIGR
ncbi:MAG TPA: RNA polymerase sigma factor [Thermoanaerobaculia bacterium]|nr:RNA polymerase sigma factor [Thermoanaerobaculia bacterium]